MREENPMKPVTVTAIIALILAIPLLIRGRKPSTVRVWTGQQPGNNDSDSRYDIDDFVT